MDNQDITQALTLVLCLVGIYCWVRKAYLHKRTAWEIAPVLSVLVHIAAFYVSVLFIMPPGPGTNYGIWSSVIRLHTVIILLALAWQRSRITWKIGSSS